MSRCLALCVVGLRVAHRTRHMRCGHAGVSWRYVICIGCASKRDPACAASCVQRGCGGVEGGTMQQLSFHGHRQTAHRVPAGYKMTGGGQCAPPDLISSAGTCEAGAKAVGCHFAGEYVATHGGYDQSPVSCRVIGYRKSTEPRRRRLPCALVIITWLTWPRPERGNCKRTRA